MFCAFKAACPGNSRHEFLPNCLQTAATLIGRGSGLSAHAEIPCRVASVIFGPADDFGHLPARIIGWQVTWTQHRDYGMRSTGGLWPGSAPQALAASGQEAHPKQGQSHGQGLWPGRRAHGRQASTTPIRPQASNTTLCVPALGHLLSPLSHLHRAPRSSHRVSHSIRRVPRSSHRAPRSFHRAPRSSHRAPHSSHKGPSQLAQGPSQLAQGLSQHSQGPSQLS